LSGDLDEAKEIFDELMKLTVKLSWLLKTYSVYLLLKKGKKNGKRN
jgi:hypothetical protein